EAPERFLSCLRIRQNDDGGFCGGHDQTPGRLGLSNVAYVIVLNVRYNNAATTILMSTRPEYSPESAWRSLIMRRWLPYARGEAARHRVPCCSVATACTDPRSID